MLFICRLIDALHPGKINWSNKTFQVPKIEAMKIMRERERIAMFSKNVVDYGVADTYTFPTESLHERGALNLAQVCVCIRALGVEVCAIQLTVVGILAISVFINSYIDICTVVNMDISLINISIMFNLSCSVVLHIPRYSI